MGQVGEGGSVPGFGPREGLRDLHKKWVDDRSGQIHQLLPCFLSGQLAAYHLPHSRPTYRLPPTAYSFVQTDFCIRRGDCCHCE